MTAIGWLPTAAPSTCACGSQALARGLCGPCAARLDERPRLYLVRPPRKRKSRSTHYRDRMLAAVLDALPATATTVALAIGRSEVSAREWLLLLEGRGDVRRDHGRAMPGGYRGGNADWWVRNEGDKP